MGSPANSGLGPPPLNTPIGSTGADQFGVPFENRPAQPLPAANIAVSWGQWFNAIYSTLSAFIASAFVNPMTTLGDLVYENATPTAVRLAGNTTATLEVLTSTGTGATATAPAWQDPTAFLLAYASLVKLGQTAALVPTSVRRVAAPLPAGEYVAVINLAAAITGVKTLNGALAYTDPKGGAVIDVFGPLTSTGVATLVVGVSPDGVADVTAAVSAAGAGTVSYDLKVYVLKVA